MAKRGKPSHAVDHIERVLRDNGLALVRCEQVQLRLENGAWQVRWSSRRAREVTALASYRGGCACCGTTFTMPVAMLQSNWRFTA
jgi:hypothetical protein